MKIASIETFPLFISKEAANSAYANDTAIAKHGYMLQPPWRSLYSTGYETLLIKVTTDEGLVGWGESLAPVAPEVAEAIVKRLLAPLIIGEDPRAAKVLWSRMSESMRERGHLTGHQADAMAGVDIALWDLWGKATGQSITELIGGAFSAPVHTYVSGIRASDDRGRADRARELYEAGTRRFKLHLGQTVSQDLATFDAIAEVAPDAVFAVDAHWTYRLGEAKMLGRELDDRKAWFFEAPMAPEDIAGHRDLAEFIATPVAVGEAMRSRFEFSHWLEHHAFGVAQPDIGRTGITEGLAIAGLSEAFNVPVAPHHSAALGIAMAAGLHVSAASPLLLAFEYQPVTLPVANSVLTTPLEVDAQGDFTVPAGPGLGIEVDEDAVRALARK